MYRCGMAGSLVLVVMGLVLVGLLACGALGMSVLAFQAGQAQGYATGAVQSGGEGVAPMPYGYHGLLTEGTFSWPLLCFGGFVLLLLVPVLLLPLRVVAFAGGRPWHRKCCGPGAPCSDEMPGEAREHMKRHFRHSSPCSPGPWMFRRGMRGRRHGSWWTDEEMPDEVKQWFHQHFGHWAEDHPSQPEAPAGEPAGEPAAETE